MKTIDVDVATQTCYPVYPCEQRGPRVETDHGERYAVHTLVDDFYRHTWKKTAHGPVVRCDTCARWQSIGLDELARMVLDLFSDLAAVPPLPNLTYRKARPQCPSTSQN